MLLRLLASPVVHGVLLLQDTRRWLLKQDDMENTGRNSHMHRLDGTEGSALHDKKAEPEAWLQVCADEKGPLSSRHNRTLDLLNGRSIMFIGDSTTRYQYLELAYYTIYGQCPDPLSDSYILSESVIRERADQVGKSEAQRWATFYRQTTAQLNANLGSRWSREACFCSRMGGHHPIAETRLFSMEDAEVCPLPSRLSQHAPCFCSNFPKPS
jgi:hypothetical protein